jgi:uncharacterized protein YigA (DUF484 family)
MNKQPIREPDASPGEDAVVDYLMAHPDFFERHASLLARLRLPHHRGSAAISLHERQVLVLRDKHSSLERKLHELIENARANEAIIDRMHRLTRRLLRSRDTRGLMGAIDASLREDFGASRWLLLVTDASLTALEGLEHPQLRRVERTDPALRIFDTFFETARPRSGQIRDTQRDYLFGTESGPVGSTVLIPLGDRGSLGLIAIASHDTERYLPTMSTDFLSRIGELLSEAITSRGT